MSDLPFPPLDLADRVGSVKDYPDPMAEFDKLGRLARLDLLEVLPKSWDFKGKTVLDFGCGAGRTMRHFAAEASEAAAFHGCDIDAESIEWLDRRLCPPFTVAVNGEEPPLPYADKSFDLIYGVSIFTHLSGTWSAWLREMHRVLNDDGIMIQTFMGEGIAEVITGIPWDEDTTGMLVTKDGQSWDIGGPMVVHSPWWLREHWGRAFEILEIRPSGFIQEHSSQGIVVVRKKGALPEIGELERVDPKNRLEAAALARNLELVQAEARFLRSQVAAAETEVARKDEVVNGLIGSTSWRLTTPLRRAKQVVSRQR